MSAKAGNTADASSPSRVRERVLALVPEIRRRAAEIEATSTVPQDLLLKLEAAGAFRMCLPSQFGGEELRHQEVTEIIEAVASADASTAWHLMVTVGAQIAVSRLPIESQNKFYSTGPDTWPKIALTPKCVAEQVEGGYKLSGRWPLASGARKFDWICLGFLVKEGNGIRMEPNGMPDMRFGLFPRGDAKVIETWDAVGLRGTRSDDVEIKDVFIPDAWQSQVFGRPNFQARTVGVTFPVCTAPQHNAVVTGILKGALADMVEMSLTRKPAFSPNTLMKDDPVFRDRFGMIQSRADALFALGDRTIEILDRCDDERRDTTAMEGAQILSWESLIHHEGAVLMNEIVALSGSAGIYSSNALQRRWRDLRCAAAHQVANISNFGRYTTALVDAVSEASQKN